MPQPGEHPPDVFEALARGAPRVQHYLLLGELGRGGMGSVHKAYDLALKRYVAIKVIVDPRGTDRFAVEATAAARLEHPGIVRVLDAGTNAGRPYLVMELVVGESLEHLLRRSRPSWSQIAAIVRDAALALAHAHGNGIVHRDVKPENILIDTSGRPRLADFGLARDLETAERLTQTGSLLGTPRYMSPEQAGGDKALQGPSVDIYGLGGVLYRALAGVPPFEGETHAALLKKILFDEPRRPRAADPQVPRDLEAIALRCLAKEPGARYASAAGLADDLGRYLAGEPILAASPGLVGRAVRRLARDWKTVAGLLAFALTASVAAVAVLELRARSREARLSELIQRGMVEMTAGDAKAATATFDAAVALDERSAAARAQRARSRLASGDATGALADAQLACELDPASGLAWAVLGKIHAAKGDLEAAQRELGRAVSLDPALGREAAVPFVLRARQLNESQRHAGGLAEALRGLSCVPDSADAHAEEALALCGLRRFKEARDAASRAISLDARCQRALVARGVALYSLGQAELAARDFDRAIELAPGDAMCFVLRGKLLSEHGERQQGLADLERALALEPRNAAAWANRGWARGLVKDWAGARADLDKALELAPGLPDAWANRGIVRRKQHDLDGARADYTRCIELDPGDARALADRGTVEIELGDLAAAELDFENALRLDPLLTRAWVGRGAVRLRRGDTEGAIAGYSKAIELDPGEHTAWSNRGNAHRLRKELAEALSDLDRAVSLAPDYLAARVNRAAARLESGHLREALEDYDKAASLAPDFPEVLYGRGKLRARLGVATARADLERFVELAPNDARVPDARATLERLGSGK